MNNKSGNANKKSSLPNKPVSFKFCMISIVIASLFPGVVYADAEFENIFLHKNKNGATPDVFLYRNNVTPGLKNVDVVVNGKLVDQFSIHFIEDKANKAVYPCLSYALLTTLGIKASLYEGWINAAAGTAETESKTPKKTTEVGAGQQCEDVPAHIPQAK